MPSPPDRLLVSRSPGETRLALAGAQGAVELAVIRREHVVGGVWLGRVVGVGAGGFAFVDIGLARPGVVRGQALREGEAVLVQGQADPRRDKGARLTTEVSLAGRLLVYSPTRPGVAVSRRMGPPAGRDRLARAVGAMAHAGEGVVVRAAAADADDEALRAELERLRAAWAEIEGARAAATPPACLLPPDPIGRMLADAPGVGRILVDDTTAFAEMRRRFPDIAEREESVAEALDEAIAEALGREVPLPSGGRLVIDETAAATLVDVDAGAGPAAAANAEAVAALLRQMRLRNLSGHILLDAVPGPGGGWGAARALAKRLGDDPVPAQVAGVTKLGLIELTRERRRASLAEVMLETQYSPTPETAALAALRRLLREARHRPTVSGLRVAPEVAAALNALPGPLAEAERRLGRRLGIEAQPGRAREDCEIF